MPSRPGICRPGGLLAVYQELWLLLLIKRTLTPVFRNELACFLGVHSAMQKHRSLWAVHSPTREGAGGFLPAGRCLPEQGHLGEGGQPGSPDTSGMPAPRAFSFSVALVCKFRCLKESTQGQELAQCLDTS